jgi:hypothetical protein
MARGFPWSHGQIPLTDASRSSIPDRTLPLERTRVVHHGALHREAAVRANRERHESLAGRRNVGGERSNHKARREEMRFID